VSVCVCVCSHAMCLYVYYSISARQWNTERVTPDVAKFPQSIRWHDTGNNHSNSDFLTQQSGNNII